MRKRTVRLTESELRDFNYVLERVSLYLKYDNPSFAQRAIGTLDVESELKARAIPKRINVDDELPQ